MQPRLWCGIVTPWSWKACVVVILAVHARPSLYGQQSDDSMTPSGTEPGSRMTSDSDRKNSSAARSLVQSAMRSTPRPKSAYVNTSAAVLPAVVRPSRTLQQVQSALSIAQPTSGNAGHASHIAATSTVQLPPAVSEVDLTENQNAHVSKSPPFLSSIPPQAQPSDITWPRHDDIIALTEHKIQRFGRKCDDPQESEDAIKVTSTVAATTTPGELPVRISSTSFTPNLRDFFLQLSSSEELESNMSNHTNVTTSLPAHGHSLGSTSTVAADVAALLKAGTPNRSASRNKENQSAQQPTWRPTATGHWIGESPDAVSREKIALAALLRALADGNTSLSVLPPSLANALANDTVIASLSNALATVPMPDPNLWSNSSVIGQAAMSGMQATHGVPNFAAFGPAGGRFDLFQGQTGQNGFVETPMTSIGLAPARPGDARGSDIFSPQGIVIILALACIAGGVGLVATFYLRASPSAQELEVFSRPASSAVRSFVEALPQCSAADVEHRLPAASGYDCALSRPLSSMEVLRLEARVEGPLTGAILTSPLKHQPCVLYSATVARQLHDGMLPVPTAFSSANLDFAISLLGGAHIRVELRGEDVSLFDMTGGRCAERCTFAEAPEAWQDFVLTHPAASPGGEWLTSSMLRADSSTLEFQECALLVGSVVTLVGELHRSADGKLTVRPLQDEGLSLLAAAPHMQGLTSWERDAGVSDDAATVDSLPGTKAVNPKDLQPDKVLVSDDPLLLEKPKDEEVLPPPPPNWFRRLLGAQMSRQPVCSTS